MEEKEKVGSEVTAAQLLDIAWQYRWLMLVIAIIAMLIVYVKMVQFTDDTFTATGILYVSNKDDSIQGENGRIQQSDIDTSRKLNTTCIEILGTTDFLEDVSRTIGSGQTGAQIKDMTTLESVNETELLKISVKSKTAADSYIIAKTYLEKAPKKLKEVYKSGEVEIVDEAKLPKAPDAKPITRNVMLGALAGLLIAYIIGFFRTMVDNKVHKSEDVAKRYGLSVLGEISQ